MRKSLEILEQYWGYKKFRTLQEEIIDDVIYGHDTLAILPTGGGKSICFQVPGIAREGLTLVISPLISLMQDQVKNLNKRGIRAKEIISGMSYREIDITLDNAVFGGLEFLYTSPERLKSKLFIERFKKMNIGLIVVDEAHCISEWGHDFRPTYKDIKELRNLKPDVPIIALTATATKKVQEDIIDSLELKQVKVHIGSFDRENLHFSIKKSENKLKDVVDYCENNNHSGIIYCQTRRSVKEVAKHLAAFGITVGIYHGGMSNESRKLILEEWLNDKIKIIVATNAFGMGIDKPDVRFVIHFEVPNNIEAYYQEAGRAGRDLLDAKCITFWEETDLIKLEQQILIQFPEIQTIKNVYRALCNYLKVAINSGKDETYHFDLSLFSQKFNFSINDIYYSLKQLETNNDLSFSESVFHPTKLKIAIGNTELYSFKIKNDQYLPILTFLVRSYPGIFNEFFAIDESIIANKLQLDKNVVIKQFEQLEKLGILDISWASSLPTVTFVHERLPEDYLSINQGIYNSRKEYHLNRLQSIINFVKEPICRSIQLIEYFGQKVVECGKCDICLKKVIEEKSDSETEKEILELLKNNRYHFNELMNLLSLEKDNLSTHLQNLLLKEIIKEENQYFYLN